MVQRDVGLLVEIDAIGEPLLSKSVSQICCSSAARRSASSLAFRQPLRYRFDPLERPVTTSSAYGQL
jgi:hypothetical protein